ncbi:MAG: AMP-binding protein [Aquisalimonadaceae bacterium]
MASPMDFDAQGMNWIGDWVGRWAAVAPARPALLDAGNGARYSYRDLDQRANRLARWLVETAGLVRGDRVCMLLRNRIEAVDLYLACGKVGIILAPLSYRLRPRELNDLLERIQPGLLVHEDVFDGLVTELALPASAKRTLRIADGDDSHERDVQRLALADMNRPLAMSDTYLYIHTGGTTATPKVCIVPYRQMTWNSFDLMVTGGGTLDARTLITFPFFHVGGWNSLTPILHGGGYAVITRQFDAGEVLDLVAREGIRGFGAVEAMLRFIIAHPKFADADLSSLEAVTTAGAPCAEPVMRAFHDRGITITQAYGLTEAGPSNFIHSAVDEAPDDVWRHNRSIGTSMPHCDYRIVDPETLQPVARGQTGVLCMRSMHTFGGYLGQPERTAKTLLDDGWVYSGDLAREDEDGFVYIVGRADSMFISGGENVSPEEIENVIMALPAVQQAVVIAVDDERWGQVPVAAVVAKGADDALRERLLAHCRTELAAYKVPRRVAFVDALPVTGAGKIDRNAVGAMIR